MQGNKLFAFTVPGGAGSYAPEVLYLSHGDTGADGIGSARVVSELTLVLDTLVAGVVISVELHRPGLPFSTADANWFVDAKTYNTVGLQELLQLAGYPGVRIRAKSAGTGGTQNIGVSWR